MNRLRQLANGPSIPVIIKETEISSPTTTHIYCQPFLVDFFIRRKKKDKRNPAAGDSKGLKNMLNIINEEGQRGVRSTRTFDKNISTQKSNHHSKLQNENRTSRIVFENNSSDANIPPIQSFRDCTTRKVCSEERNKVNAAQNETAKLKLKSQAKGIKSTPINKRKLKNQIPISPISAAMNVEVEMRQLTDSKTEDKSSNGNWSHNSDNDVLDSENNVNLNENHKYTEKGKDADSSISNGKAHKHRFKAKSTTTEEFNHMVKENTEIEIPSYTSSDNNATHDDETSNGTSAESDVFFSDESDESSNIIFENSYGSLQSVSRISDGSLNSLLSQTGTEMTSSSGTLTSMGLEPLFPPPVIVSPTIKESTKKVNQSVSLDSDYSTRKLTDIRNERNKSRIKQETSKKIKPEPKFSKSRKTEKPESFKHSTKNPKNIFSTLINIKSRRKQNKFENSQNKVNKQQSHPHFNMYGSNSPKNVKPLPLFLKENISPIKGNEPKNYLQSFTSVQTKLKTEILPKNKFRSEDYESHNYVNEDSSMYKANSKTHDTKVVGMNKMEVPVKYAHKVTVTPIQRQASEHRNSLVLCNKTLFKDKSDQQLTIEPNKDFNDASNSGYSSDTSNSNFFRNEKPKSQNPLILHCGKPKPAARVLLDPEGRVIHCTQSLDRRLFTIPPQNYENSINTSQTNYWFSNQKMIKTEDRAHVRHNQVQHCQTPVNATRRLNHHRFVANKSNSIAVIPVERYNSKEQELDRADYKHPTSSQKSGTESVNSRASINTNLIKILFPEPINQSHPIIYTKSFIKTETVLPDPNTSGLPVNEPITTTPIDFYSKRMEQSFVPQREKNNRMQTKDNFCPKSLQGHVNADVTKLQPNNMTTEDLFAVIHKCKKRMNIKTDSDISLTSSRSNSPSYLYPALYKGALAETGFLSPRNSSSFESCGDRSWADLRSTNNGTLERKSLASDRLGPTKPTSMHDFKMLLLQTRSNNQTLGPRKSAVEMLKIPSQHKVLRITSSPISLSPYNSVSCSVANSPTSDLNLSNGHSTVPFKRNSRARSLQSRYMMYPPIFEDCSEDSENIFAIPTLKHMLQTQIR